MSSLQLISFRISLIKISLYILLKDIVQITMFKNSFNVKLATSSLF